ncbi:MAG: 7-cyano-7-deazaguanine synthase [Candidatus Micrarchaeia archaeon]
MDKALERKLTSLRKNIRKLDSALVAFSGGVDSTFLTRICREELGEKAVAVTTLSSSYPRSELSLARRVAKIVGVKHVVVDPSNGSSGSRDMCRGSNIYSCLKSVAMRMKVNNVLDGSHMDDASEKGNSFLAAKKAGIKSPLLESDLTKAEIRLLAKEFGLPNWDKPESSSSRSRNKPSKTEAAKNFIKGFGSGASLEASGSKAVISGSKAVISSLAKNIESIEKKLKSLGFSEVMLKLST